MAAIAIFARYSLYSLYHLAASILSGLRYYPLVLQQFWVGGPGLAFVLAKFRMACISCQKRTDKLSDGYVV
jgi:hypothetical protein